MREQVPSDPRELAIWAIRPYVEGAAAVEWLNSTQMYCGGPEYQTQIRNGKIRVTKAGGVTCDRAFSLRDLYDEIRAGAIQQSLF